MKSSDANILYNLIQRGIAYSISNTMILQKLEQIDSKTSRQIQRKFMPKTVSNHKLSGDEYFNTVIKNLARQIFIREEIQNLIKKPQIALNVNFKEIRKIMQIHSQGLRQ